MTEFAEVCKQWRRMCAMYHEQHVTCCEGCPMIKNDVCGFIHEATDADIEQAESTIMDWAKANPELVYPTWLEWLKSEGVVPYLDGLTIMKYADDSFGHAHVNINEIAMQPIPADIAEKLGIKPKEG